ncbi:MAG: flavodoxin family protein, partial [Peptoniphilus lacydonensis]|nr:flavodoxin family protein [Peptoniphilus lacydonensis]
MKGIIIYSSRTGNTKRMAEKIYDILKDKYEMTIKDINDVEDERETKEYEFVLLGAWIDKGTVDNKAMKFLKKVENEKVGLFATLGAMPDSEHGKKVIKNLKELLKNKES